MRVEFNSRHTIPSHIYQTLADGLWCDSKFRAWSMNTVVTTSDEYVLIANSISQEFVCIRLTYSEDGKRAQMLQPKFHSTWAMGTRTSTTAASPTSAHVAVAFSRVSTHLPFSRIVPPYASLSHGRNSKLGFRSEEDRCDIFPQDVIYK